MQKQFVLSLSEQEFEQIKLISDVLEYLYLDIKDGKELSEYVKKGTIDAYKVLTAIIYGHFDEDAENLDYFYSETT